jgi:hypothetical protein
VDPEQCEAVLAALQRVHCSAADSIEAAN